MTTRLLEDGISSLNSDEDNAMEAQLLAEHQRRYSSITGNSDSEEDDGGHKTTKRKKNAICCCGISRKACLIFFLLFFLAIVTAGCIMFFVVLPAMAESTMKNSKVVVASVNLYQDTHRGSKNNNNKDVPALYMSAKLLFLNVTLPFGLAAELQETRLNWFYSGMKVGELTLAAISLVDGSSNSGEIACDVDHLDMKAWSLFSADQIRLRRVPMEIESIGKTWVSTTIAGITISIPLQVSKTTFVHGMEALKGKLRVDGYKIVSHDKQGHQGFFLQTNVTMFNPSQVSLSPAGVLNAAVKYNDTTIASCLSDLPVFVVPGSQEISMTGQILHPSHQLNQFTTNLLNYIGGPVDTTVHFTHNASDISFFKVALEGLDVSNVQLLPINTSVVREIVMQHVPTVAELAAWYKKGGRLIMPANIGMRNPFDVPVTIKAIHSGWSSYVIKDNTTIVEYARIDEVFDEDAYWHIPANDVAWMSPDVNVVFDDLEKSIIQDELQEVLKKGAVAGTGRNTVVMELGGVEITAGPLDLPGIPVCLKKNEDACKAIFPP